MRKMKIPPRQDFALKMQEGLMNEGGGGEGRICGTLR